ncbi:NAD(P)H-binding protein [Fulvivirgaceae bacterium PWU4]|uniref:NAD(P)H-binding protein n=1 Tax=Chryseosolibacter histidini TaxID=2782349 RepID=A0AAP2GPK2_9BACT|nr:NmrA family NAD(P)-binding protein [Chryseosolibacter histidini]MBT1698050.1 NAD(P)H-binding protein [Chryseosolibacter histidini]
MNNAKSTSKNRILVLGANGKTGGRIVQRLTTLGWPVQSAARSTTPRFDWDDSTTWAPVLQNIHSVYISFQPDLAMPGAVKTVKQFAAAAVKSGVKKMVLLSGRGEEEAQECEKVIKEAIDDWTIIRASWFSQNFSEGNFLKPVLAGHVALPVGNVKEPFIDTDDIADVAVAALTEEGHSGQLYEVTGPRLLSFKEAVEEIGKATGKEIRYEQISSKEYAVMLKEYGLPDDLISLITYLFCEVLDGRNTSVTDGVQRALGRKPTDFSEYVKKSAATGVWG